MVRQNYLMPSSMKMSIWTLLFVAFLGSFGRVAPFVVNQPCPNGWIRQDDSCYFFEIQPKSWHSAVVYCRSLRSHLVAVETSSEFNFLVEELKKMHIGSGQEYWTSGNDIEVEGNWVWNPTRNRVTLNKWHSGEPNTWHGHQEDCMTLQNRGGIILFNDEGCDYTLGFICEILWRQYTAAFQQRTRICSLGQAAGTRFALKGDDTTILSAQVF